VSGLAACTLASTTAVCARPTSTATTIAADTAICVRDAAHRRRRNGRSSARSAGPANASSNTQLDATPTIAPPTAASVSGETTRAAGTTSNTTATDSPQATAKFAIPPPMASAPGPRRNTAETNAATGNASTGRRRTAGSAQKPATTVVVTAMTTSAIACVYATSSGPSHVSSGPISSSTTPAATAWKPCG
jgi:hypothetical protein